MEFVTSELLRVERGIDASTDRAGVLRSLRALGLDDFGQLMFSLPDAAYPALSRVLPAMASAEVQRNWTGASGTHLLLQTLDFVRSVCYNFSRFTGESLEDKAVLDFGCGYGRIARLFYYFVDPSMFYGVDPWDESIRLCAESGLTENFHVSDYLPTDLPTGSRSFDLIYAFSVFTHLSERATRTSIRTLLRKLSANGMLTITIRPVEYWHQDQHAGQSEGTTENLIRQHRQQGFAFLPHLRPAVDGDVTYGDTSMSLAWLAANFPEARILGVDRSLKDPYQIYVFLRNARDERAQAEPSAVSMTGVSTAVVPAG